MKKIFWFVLVTTVLIVSLAVPRSVLSQETIPITLTDLNITECGSTAADINEVGQIVGWTSGYLCGESYAFFRDIDGSVVNLGFIASAYGINDLGQVVGGIQGETDTGYQAFLWTEATGIKKLQTIEPWPFSVAYEINNQGQVVGCYNTYPQWGTNGAFLWTAGSGMRDLNKETGAPLTCAYDINESGQIVGLSLNGPFIWTPGVGVYYITNNQYDYAYSINDAGQVVGSASPGGNYIWSAADGMTYLGFHDENFIGINDLGQVSGQFQQSDTYYQSYLWTPDIGTLLLPGLGNPDNLNSFAGRSNNNGQIVGVSGDHAVLWTVELPAPTPQKQIALINTKVDALVIAGMLKKGEGKVLTTELDRAIKLLDKGKTIQARVVLRTFIYTVNAFVKSGRLTSAQAQPLIDSTNVVIKMLK